MKRKTCNFLFFIVIQRRECRGTIEIETQNTLQLSLISARDMNPLMILISIGNLKRPTIPITCFVPHKNTFARQATKGEKVKIESYELFTVFERKQIRSSHKRDFKSWPKKNIWSATHSYMDTSSGVPFFGCYCRMLKRRHGQGLFMSKH